MFRLHPLAAAVLGLGLATASHARIGPVIDVAPLVQVRNDSLTDYFYSIDPGQISIAQSCCGYYGPTSVAYVPVFPDGYEGIRPFARYWKGAPQNEHFYTIDGWERSQIEPLGWQYERDEGALFDAHKPGLSPVHRLHQARWDGDLQHFYTTVEGTKNQFMQAGWNLDGVAGYAFAYRVPTTQEHAAPHIWNNTLYLVAPAVYDSRTGEYACGGTVKVTLDGTPMGTFGSFVYGTLPGSWQKACYTGTGRYLSQGSHTARFETSGYAARVSGLTADAQRYDYWQLVAPATRVLNFYRN